MIAACAYFHLARGERSGMELDVEPNLRLAGTETPTIARAAVGV